MHYELTIRESHLDTFGHVNNATYLAILEEARWDLITRNGYGLSEIQKRGLGPVILEIKLEFKKEIRNRERVRIETKGLEYKGKIGILEQKILNENGEVCTRAEFTFGLFDLKARKLVQPTLDWLRAIEMA